METVTSNLDVKQLYELIFNQYVTNTLKLNIVSEANNNNCHDSKNLYNLTNYPEYFLIDFQQRSSLEKYLKISKYFNVTNLVKIPEYLEIDNTRILVKNLGKLSLKYLAEHSSNYGIFRQAIEQSVLLLSKCYKHQTSTYKNSATEQSYIKIDKIVKIPNREFDNNHKFVNQALVEMFDIMKRYESLYVDTNVCISHTNFANNVIWHKGQIYFINIHKIRLNPVLDSLASLLYDSDISLPNKERKLLAKLFFENHPELEDPFKVYLYGILRLVKIILRLFNNNNPDENCKEKIVQCLYIYNSVHSDIMNLNNINDGISNNYNTMFLDILYHKIVDYYNQINQSDTKLFTIVLGAGQGKRMKSSLPKVLHTCLNLPMIEYPLRTAQMISSDQIYVVTGYKSKEVTQYIQSNIGRLFNFVIQEERLGTGHAVMITLPKIVDNNLHTDICKNTSMCDNEIILVMAGDVPVLDYEIVNSFLTNFHSKDNTENQYVAGILTTYTPNPEGCGRIIRDSENNFIGTVEEKDIGTTSEYPEELRNISEISSGTLIFRAKLLEEYIFKINNNNVQSEYYLPDVINLLLKDKLPVLAHNSNRIPAIHGANNPEQLVLVEKWMNSYICI